MASKKKAPKQQTEETPNGDLFPASESTADNVATAENAVTDTATEQPANETPATETEGEAGKDAKTPSKAKKSKGKGKGSTPVVASKTKKPKAVLKDNEWEHDLEVKDGETVKQAMERYRKELDAADPEHTHKVRKA